jgi:hypothetical protein
MSTTYLPVMPKLRTSGAILLLPLYAFVTWTDNFTVFHDPISRRCTVLDTDSSVNVSYKYSTCYNGSACHT